ncbi:MAG TPA: kynureninase [Thermoanaerobaculia bacterium]|jgi:kynureninase|nr:kynureninase [Thermoanaerobaculia bacterium]
MTPLDPATLYRSPNALAPLYSRFRVAERLLLTGHSHQAWPDRAAAGQLAAFDDAALLVDEKWERAFARAHQVRSGFAHLLGDAAASIALGTSTHDLLVRFLSALPLRQRPRLVTTDAEFHSARRQLDRLAEEGIELVRVAAAPADTVGERLAAAVDDRTAAVVTSTVFFTDAGIAGALPAAAAACDRHGAELLLDAYHHLNVVPFSLRGLDGAFVVGGGYKYCQLGEGNAFLRVPPGCRLRPTVTGWFAEFERLEAAASANAGVAYPRDSAARFAGATYDPTSHYRAAEVFAFFLQQGLTAELLREVSQHQLAVLCGAFDELDLPTALVTRDRQTPLAGFGGFLALHSPRAGGLCAALRAEGVLADARGEVLRLGPAPYLSDAQLGEAMSLLGVAARRLL